LADACNDVAEIDNPTTEEGRIAFAIRKKAQADAEAKAKLSTKKD